MKKAAEGKQPAPTATPQQVWATLTVVQQNTVLRTIVRICQGIAVQWGKEAKNERATQP